MANVFTGHHQGKTIKKNNMEPLDVSQISADFELTYLKRRSEWDS